MGEQDGTVVGMCSVLMKEICMPSWVGLSLQIFESRDLNPLRV